MSSSVEHITPVTVIQPEAAPNDTFMGPEFASLYSNSGNTALQRDPANAVNCTACGMIRDMYKDELYAHPVLKVITCESCFQFYHHGPFTKDSEGTDEQCRWCGQGGNLLMCDFCPNTFCNYCIKRNFSPDVFNEIRDNDEWECFVCEPSKLRSKAKQCKEILQKRHQSETEPQLTKNSQETLFESLAEENKRLDDLIEQVEKSSDENQEAVPVQVKTEQEPEDSRFPVNHFAQNSLLDEPLKVTPITILRAKESYVIQQRSVSCDESVNTKDDAKWQSDPENHSAKVKIAVGRQASLQKNFGTRKQTENNMNMANITEDVVMPEEAALPTDVQKPEKLKKPDDTLPNHETASSNHIITNGPSHAPRRNVGKRTGHKVKLDPVKSAVESTELEALPSTSTSNHEVSTQAKTNHQLSLNNKVREAEEHFSRFMRIYKELMVDQSVQDSISKTDQLQSPSQYLRFRTTNMLLTKVKKASSRLIRMEHDLRSRKTQLGTYRESNDSDFSLSSSEDEFLSDMEEKRMKKRKKLLDYYHDEPRLENTSHKALEFGKMELDQPSTSKDVPSTSKDTPSTSKSPAPSASVESKDIRVLLKKLTQEEIEQLSQGSKKADTGSDTTLESLDTDSSKNLKRGETSEDSDATTLDGDFSDYEEDLTPKKTKGSKRREKRKSRREKIHLRSKYEKDSDFEMNSDNISSDSDRSEFDSAENIDDESVDIGNNDNDIAMSMLLQKMQEQDGDTSDSDVEKLVDKGEDAMKRTEKSEERRKKSTEESGGGATTGEENISDKKKSFKHPLLKQKWKDASDDEEAEKDKKETGTMVNGRRKRDREEKKTTRLLNGFDASNSDSNLTTDSDTDLPVKKRKLNESKHKKMILDSDSDGDVVLIGSGIDDEDAVTSSKENGAKEAASLTSSEDESDSDFEDTKKQPVKKKRRRLIANSDSDPEAKIMEDPDGDEDTPRKRGRKNIRKILDDEQVSQSTQKASKEEMQRRKRVDAERQWEEEKEEVIVIDEENNSEIKKQVVVGLTLSKDPLVQVHRHLVKSFKPHQVEGVQFLWDNIIERVKDANTKRGNGCILAHCMGLGKTLQTVAFLYTVLMSKHLPKLQTALVLCPLGTVNNWVAEFKKWLPKSHENPDNKFRKLYVMDLNSAKTDNERMDRLRGWKNHGGVMIMGYGLFRTILSDRKRQTRRSKEHFVERLSNPGPDILVCDEGHILKNVMSRIATIVQEVQTRRRIILTGTPLQNNMIEYHCMVSIVKPRLLGTLKEFKNRFVNPIENGQHVDSTESDVKLMKKRAHVLHELLSGCVQRKDYFCLRSHIAPKQEYTLKVRLSDLQIRLYEKYLTLHTSADVKLKSASLFNDFNKLMLLVCHPRCLVIAKEKKLAKDNVADGESSESETEDLSSDDSVIMISDDEMPASQVPKPTCLDDLYALSGWKLRHFIEDKSGKKPETRSRKKLVNLAAKYLDENFCKTVEFEESLREKSVSQLKAMITEHGGSFVGCTEKTDLIHLVKSLVLKHTKANQEWFEQFMPAQEKLYYANEHGGKIMLMLDILQGAAKLGDKVVIFSQSLMTLDFIEEVLRAEMKAMSRGLKPPAEPFAKWCKNRDYYRLDGSTPGSCRDEWIAKFNDKSNTRGRVFLISTRAGGIGINLIGANRAIVFDASWNPSHDIQSIFRIYRFGQTKPCIIYRLIAYGTMEEKVYERQVVKRSLAFRVVDEQQIERHFTSADISELYKFKPAPSPKTTSDLPPPQDALLASILLSRNLVVSYHKPDSLLDHQVSEELTEAERRAAWEEYDTENSVKPTVTPACTNYFRAISSSVLLNLCRKGDNMLQTIQSKISQIGGKPWERLMLEFQLKDRFISPEEAMRKAVAQKLEQHIALRRLNNLKAKVTKYRLEALSVYQARTVTAGITQATLPSSSNPQPSSSRPFVTPATVTNPAFSNNRPRARGTTFTGFQHRYPPYQANTRPRATPQQRPYIPRTMPSYSRTQTHTAPPRPNMPPRTAAPRPNIPPRTRPVRPNVPFSSRPPPRQHGPRQPFRSSVFNQNRDSFPHFLNPNNRPRQPYTVPR